MRCNPDTIPPISDKAEQKNQVRYPLRSRGLLAYYRASVVSMANSDMSWLRTKNMGNLSASWILDPKSWESMT